MKRIIGVFLSLLVLVSSVTTVFGAEEQELRHREIPAEQLETLSYDPGQFETLAERTMELCTREENLPQVQDMLGQLREMFLLLNTKMELSSIASYRDVTDMQAVDDYSVYTEAYYDASDLLGAMVPAVLDSPCSEALDPEDPVFGPYQWGSEPYSPEERSLMAEEQELVDQYYLGLNQVYTVDFQGKTYTQEQAVDAWYEDLLTDEEYDEVSTLLAAEKNSHLAQYYVDLVENRRYQAEIYGESDTAAYYDIYYYWRDVSQFQRENLYQAVKTWIVPLLGAIENKIYESCDYETVTFTPEELLGTLEAGLGTVSGEFSPALCYMKKFGYYDISPGENKVEGAFTTYLSYPDAPYLFMNPTESSLDFSTIVHEFGHFNAYYCSPEPASSNLDLAEVHSQGLELLMLPYYDEVFGQGADRERLYTMYNILVSFVDGCMIDELERYAYEKENLTVSDMNEKYMVLLKEYGYRDPTDPAVNGYSWVETYHMFDYPVYYLSYAVSAAAAMEIWENSQEDYAGAVEQYLTLVALGESGTFADTLEAAGLEDPLSSAYMKELAEQVSREYELDFEAAEIGNSAGLVLGIIVWIMILAALAGVIILVVVLGKEKRKRAEFGEQFYNSTACTAGAGGEAYRGGRIPTPAAGGEDGWREGGTTDDFPGADQSPVSASEADETAGSDR